MDCIIFTDEVGKIVEFNRAAEATFGYLRQEVIGKDLTDVFVPADLRERHRQNLDRYMGAGELGSMLGRRLEPPMIRKNGEQFQAEMTTQPIPLPEGSRRLRRLRAGYHPDEEGGSRTGTRQRRGRKRQPRQGRISWPT